MDHGTVFAASSHYYAGLFGLTAGVWFIYFRVKQRAPSPFAHRLLAMVGGFLSALVALSLFYALDAWGVGVEWSDLSSSWSRSTRASLIIGVVEELAKMLPVFAIAALASSKRRPKDILFLATLAGIGFAAAENMILSQSNEGLTFIEGLARAAVAPVTHALFAAPWGLGIGGWLLKKKPSALVLGLAASVATHGMYDLVLARPHVPQALAGLIVLSLWIWLLVRTAPSVKKPSLGPGPVPSPALARRTTSTTHLRVTGA